jgi:C4-dicarboxylate transporter DctQ subunit
MKKFFPKFEYYSILFAASAIIVFVFSSIVLRYLFNIVLSWPDELSRYLQLYIVWMGASASFTRKRVLKIDFLHMVINNKRGVEFLADVITLIGTVILLLAICQFTYNKFQLMETSMIIGIPIWIIGLAITLSVISLVIKVSMSVVGFFLKREVVEAP